MLSPKNKRLKSSYMTFILIPEKLGTSRSFKVPKYIVVMLISVSLLILASLIILTLNFSLLIRKKSNYEKNIQFLNTNNSKLQLEIIDIKASYNAQLDEVKKHEELLREKLKDLEKIEGELKDNLSSRGIKISSPKTISLDAEDVITQTDIEISHLNSFIANLNQAVSMLDHKPSILPYQGKITSCYGSRKSPTSRGRYELHTGVDIAGPYNSKIVSAADGVVEQTGWSGNYGKLVIVNHGNGYKTYYGHTSRILVKKGQRVNKGQTIALMGSTGRSTGCHVHFEVRINGKPINPLKILNGRD